MRGVLRFLFGFRPEETVSLLFFVPMAVALVSLSLAPGAPVDHAAAGYPDSFVRLVTLVGSVIVFLWVVRTKPHWELARDSLPFLFAANIYGNLHDLIRFYGFPNITNDLRRWDAALFGVEPTVWAQRFLNPSLTDFFTVCYWLFYVTPPLLGLLLYLKRDRRAFRETMVSIVLCLYLGYIGYVLWPASAPRLAIPGAYGTALHGFSALLDESRVAPAAIPLTAYGAFPSLHCAVAILTILLAWRHLRWFFPIQLFFGIGLVLGTVYLRHHWVVDILAGLVLTVLTFWAGPRVETWWERMAARYAAASDRDTDDEPEEPMTPARAADGR
ncbi:MAG: phosphatase PAP2 family protein [Hyphomicrobiales bacterium]